RGLDFYLCHVPLRDDLAVTLQLWDVSDCPCAPGDHDPAPLAAYLFNAQAVLLLYDATSPASLEALRYAAAAVDAIAQAAGGARPYLALVAAKCDLLAVSEHGGGPAPLVSEPLAAELAARHGCVRLAVSARSGEGVAGAAAQLAADLAGVPLSATDHAHLQHQNQLQQQQLSMGGMGVRGVGPGGGDFGMPQQQPGLSHPRAPAYQPSPDPFGGGHGGSGAWRPVGRSATPSPTALLISKAGPFGQRASARSASAPAPDAAQERSGGGGVSSSGGAGEEAASLGRGRWRALFCCCGG
ncbi:Ras-related protein Rab-28, partial [Tetrabaena socialis]